jgi:tetratricopeptide (TPR) repeat protein
MKRVKRIIPAILMLISLAALATVCGKTLYNSGTVKIDPYYLTGSRENREYFRDLFTLLDGENNSPESTFAVVREIANSFAGEKEYGRLIHFLSGRTINYPHDPYNSYYLLMIAYAYMQQDALPVAAQYFDLIVKNYPDLTVNRESIHLACLNQLKEKKKNPAQQVWYYQELVLRFSDRIDLGTTWFMLAQTYERIGEWNNAIQAYTRYLSHAGTLISGFPNAENYARQQVDFNNSRKDWTFENLPALLATVKAALDDGNSWQLGRCQAKVNFFARSWGQGEVDNASMADFILSNFMQSNRIRYADQLDASSNSTEAFLRTWGWSQYVSTWYLYFRKIYFPSDPEIHGRWEWAGIYYGDKF